MKKVFLAISMIASLMAVSCKKEETPSVSEEPEYVEVKIGTTGDITYSLEGFTKSSSDDNIYGIQIESCPENGNSYSHYAYGLFDNDNISVSLIKGYKYKIYVAYGFLSSESGKSFFKFSTGGGSQNISRSSVTNKFTFNTTKSLSFGTTGFVQGEYFYGSSEEDFIPTENASVTINLSRISFGLDISVKNFTDGTISITTSNTTYPNPSISAPSISYPSTSSFTLYALRLYETSLTNANHTEDMTISAKLVNKDGITYSLGSAVVKVARNKKTKVVINAAPEKTNNGMVMTYTNEDMTDYSETYEIGNNESVDTPIGNN